MKLLMVRRLEIELQHPWHRWPWRRRTRIDISIIKVDDELCGTCDRVSADSVVGAPWRLTQHRPIFFFLASLRR